MTPLTHGKHPSTSMKLKSAATALRSKATKGTALTVKEKHSQGPNLSVVIKGDFSSVTITKETGCIVHGSGVSAKLVSSSGYISGRGSSISSSLDIITVSRLVIKSSIIIEEEGIEREFSVVREIVEEGEIERDSSAVLEAADGESTEGCSSRMLVEGVGVQRSWAVLEEGEGKGEGPGSCASVLTCCMPPPPAGCSKDTEEKPPSVGSSLDSKSSYIVHQLPVH
ncbi:hypothetical protein Hamer_G006562 [Homarus americanus]|uniref:Uncharacterized protein n=1 Tax=Homarus americanus TaxID=6706 RepID=A0A8J5JFX0_HOMAM|nr:hypothetical protein Hamer_G006562 [Homarus americanus]